MAQLAAGRFRLAKLDANGRELETSESVEYDILDNAAAPRTMVNKDGSSEDHPAISFPTWVNGPEGEVLAIQVNHTAAVTIDTSACTLLAQIVRATKSGGKRKTIPDTWTIRNRITQSTAGTINDPRGLDDDTVTLANKWSNVLLIAPDRHENVAMNGQWRFVFDAV